LPICASALNNKAKLQISSPAARDPHWLILLLLLFIVSLAVLPLIWWFVLLVLPDITTGEKTGPISSLTQIFFQPVAPSACPAAPFHPVKREARGIAISRAGNFFTILLGLAPSPASGVGAETHMAALNGTADAIPFQASPANRQV
jgi:hypothetical protein